MNAPAPGWNPDPTGRHEYRYWDGSTWTDDVSDGGVTAIDPVGGPTSPGGEPTTTIDPTQQYGPQTGPQPGGFGPQDQPAGGFGTPGPPAGPFGPQGAPPGGFGGPPGGYDTYGGGPVPPGRPVKSGPSTGLIVGLVALAVAVIAGVAFLLAGGGDDDDTATDDSTTTTGDTSSDTTEDTTEDTTDTGSSGVFELAVGDCLADDTSMTGEVQEVPTVPCDQPHAAEVYYSYQIPDGELPDTTEMETIVEEQCVGNFESFVGLPYNDSVLLVTWLEPTSGSWDAGDRELLCIVKDPAGNVTGTLAGANR